MCPPPALPKPSTWRPLLDRALEEDVGHGDLTAERTIPRDAQGDARIEARQELVVCGLPIAVATFQATDPAIACHIEAEEGTPVGTMTSLLRVTGPLRSILAAERTALNFLSRMSGVASLTRQYADAIRGTPATLVDTRKTVPGWRHLDKYATAVGGAENHRFGLFDGILIKDNHVAICGGVEPALRAAQGGAPSDLPIQIEVQNEEEAAQAADAGATFLLLDNMEPNAVRQVVSKLGDRVLLEASGGIGLDNVRDYAKTGVHRISVGALTHSATAADVSLEMCEAEEGGP